jgi:dolichol-phosphate mannosyltransferase
MLQNQNCQSPSGFAADGIAEQTTPVSRQRNLQASERVKLTVVIPCYNEELTLEPCVDDVLAIQDDTLELEVIVVDDRSTDGSLKVAERLAACMPNLRILSHDRNRGKGAALRTGIAEATGDFVAIQDADREYNPTDLKRLLVPLRNGEADVVLGSRFLSAGYHRVLYFWHSLGNRLLTMLSNMLTDLNLTDMETCYKVFRRDVIQSIRIDEDRFGFEPEVVAKIAQMRLRIYEMGISYKGRTYAEGKKIGMKDAWRALYCILKYNLPTVPIAVQFIFYTLIGSMAAVVNLVVFLAVLSFGVGVSAAALTAFSVAAFVNYYCSIKLLFRHNAKWNTISELIVFLAVVVVVGGVDLYCTQFLMSVGAQPALAKASSTAIGLVLNFAGRHFIVFPENPRPDWKPQQPSSTPASDTSWLMVEGRVRTAPNSSPVPNTESTNASVPDVVWK